MISSAGKAAPVTRISLPKKGKTASDNRASKASNPRTTRKRSGSSPPPATSSKRTRISVPDDEEVQSEDELNIKRTRSSVRKDHPIVRKGKGKGKRVRPSSFHSSIDSLSLLFSLLPSRRRLLRLLSQSLLLFLLRLRLLTSSRASHSVPTPMLVLLAMDT